MQWKARSKTRQPVPTEYIGCRQLWALVDSKFKHGRMSWMVSDPLWNFVLVMGSNDTGGVDAVALLAFIRQLPYKRATA